MPTAQTTFAVILVAIAALLGYDLYAFIAGGMPITISGVIIRYSQTIPAIPFFFGCLMGHLFL